MKEADSNGGVKVVGLLGAFALLAGLFNSMNAPSDLRITSNSEDIDAINVKIDIDNIREAEDQGKFSAIEQKIVGHLERLKSIEKLFDQRNEFILERLVKLEMETKEFGVSRTSLMQDNYESQLRELKRELDRKVGSN